MIGEKVSHYQNKNTDLASLKSKIEEYLTSEKFKIQSSVPSPHGIVIQAHKGGWLSSIITADRALTIMLDGEPNDFTVRVGVGRWLKHLGITAAEALLLTDLFLFVDIPETLWNFEIENKIAKEINSFIG